jgi:tRNA modification GTPase
LESARSKLPEERQKELMASDLRGALEAFGRISGKIDNEKMLDRLFASFCIGK